MGKLRGIFKSEKMLIIVSFVFIAVIICYSYYDVAVDKTDSNSYSKTQALSMTVELVNINTADVTTLCKLPNVKEGTAKKIISYRQENGDFETIEEIQNVKGIGYQDYIRLQPLITVE